MKNPAKATLAVFSLTILCLVSFAGTPVVSATANRPVFVWLFGYTGDNFLPQQELGVTPQNLLSAVQNISASVGSSNLRLVDAVGEEPGGNVQSQMIPTIKSYIDSLRQYASVVYARIDLEEFNTSSSSSLFSQVSIFVNEMDINGFWFDHGPNLWQATGSTAFNAMMQNLSSSFPKIRFILNQATNLGGWITPSKGTTWGERTYISPTVLSGTYNQLSLKTIAALNAIYPGRVLVHFDAFASSMMEAMGIFANQSASVEKSTINHLSYSGIHPQSTNYSYSLLFPVLGAWTSTYSVYNGTLYNGLTIGAFARGTLPRFTEIMART